ncbi:MAG: hemerythrin domain-containing protein [Myxococcales bacterium]|jgi:iron-sulfur cluster repair protein YtfE (RIC family)
MTIGQQLPTEPLRAEHRALLSRLGELDRLASELPALPPDEARARLRRLIAFLRHHLLPHAMAEEKTLYPAIEAAMGAPGATATMFADHSEITRRIEALDAAARRPDLSSVPAMLYGLSAIVLLHFRKEEEVLLPVLDRALSLEDAANLLQQMAADAGETSEEQPAAPS